MGWLLSGYYKVIAPMLMPALGNPAFDAEDKLLKPPYTQLRTQNPKLERPLINALGS